MSYLCVQSGKAQSRLGAHGSCVAYSVSPLALVGFFLGSVGGAPFNKLTALKLDVADLIFWFLLKSQYVVVLFFFFF